MLRLATLRNNERLRSFDGWRLCRMSYNQCSSMAKGLAMQKLRQERAQIAERLQAARLRAGCSISDAAEASNVLSPAIEAWESGKSRPCLVQFRSLIALYGVAGYQILFGENLFEMSRVERVELVALTKHSSPALQRRLELLFTLLAKARVDDA